MKSVFAGPFYFPRIKLPSVDINPGGDRRGNVPILSDWKPHLPQTPFNPYVLTGSRMGESIPPEGICLRWGGQHSDMS